MLSTSFGILRAQMFTRLNQRLHQDSCARKDLLAVLVCLENLTIGPYAYTEHIAYHLQGADVHEADGRTD